MGTLCGAHRADYTNPALTHDVTKEFALVSNWGPEDVLQSCTRSFQNFQARVGDLLFVATFFGVFGQCGFAQSCDITNRDPLALFGNHEFSGARSRDTEDAPHYKNKNLLSI